VKPIRFTRGSRKHRVGKKSAYHVIAMTAATITIDPDTGETTLSWVADDERGREPRDRGDRETRLLPHVHVMPTHYRREGR